MMPQLRSRANLTERGYLVATVEAIKRFPDRKSRGPCKCCGQLRLIQVKTDLFGCFDLIAEHPQKRERMYVQVTSQTNHATRRNKILASFEAKLVLLAGARIVIQSWKKQDGRYQLREEEIVLADYKQAVSYPNDVAGLMEIRRKAKKPDLPPGSTLPYQPIKDADLPF